MRLIDADALKVVFEEKSSEAVCGVKLCKAIISRIDEAPTVDAVPFIKCKDCVFWGIRIDTLKRGYCRKYDHMARGKDYCAWAEEANR